MIMGKPLRVSVSVSLSTLTHESRVSTRSTAGPVKCCNLRYLFRFQKTKDDVLKPICVLRKPARRIRITGKANLLNKTSALSSSNKVASIRAKESEKKKPDPSQRLRLELPAYRVLGRMEPLRATPRHNDEICTDDAYLKRHEKYEKQEKSIKRRDRIWQREEQYRLRLMKISKNKMPSQPKICAIEVVSKKPKTRSH